MTIDDWKFINTFAPWLSAFGTLLAVCVSLYISYSTRKINLKISSGIYTFNENGTEVDYLSIQVINTGYRTAFLNSLASISFQFDDSPNKTNIGIGHEYIDPYKSSKFPCNIGENEMAQIFIKIHNNNENWLNNFKKDYLNHHKLSSLNIIAYPNIGKPFKAKPDKSIINAFNSI